MQAGQHFVGCLHDSHCLFFIKQPQIAVDQRSSAFDLCEGNDDFHRHDFGRDMKVFERTLRLCTPEPL